MPLLQLKSTGHVPELRDQTGSLDQALRSALPAQPPNTPVVIMLHGLRYDPDMPDHDPARSLFAARPSTDDPRTVSWPRHLGFARGQADEGLCIGLAWKARTWLWTAYRRATEVGVSLAHLVDAIHDIDPRREIVIVAHSLGARVALCALPHIQSGRIDRMVFIYGAEFAREADRLLAAAPSPPPDIINVTSRENWLVDGGFAAVIAGRPWAETIGSRSGTKCARWIDLPLHDRTALTILRRSGFRISTVLRSVCHWSGYTRPGVFPVYKDFLRAKGRLPLKELKKLTQNRQASMRTSSARLARALARWFHFTGFQNSSRL